MTLQTAGLRDPLSGVVRIETDAATANVVTIDVRGTIVDDVVARPAGIYANPADAIECRLSMASPVGRSFRVTGVETSDRRVRALLSGPPEAPMVLVTASRPVQALDGQMIRIRTDLPECPVVTVPIHVVRDTSGPARGASRP